MEQETNTCSGLIFIDFLSFFFYKYRISFKSDSDCSKRPAPPPEATGTPVPPQERGSPGLLSHSKDPVPAPGQEPREGFSQRRAGIAPGTLRARPGLCHPPGPEGTERSNPGMQHNREDGMEGGRNGLRQVPTGLGAEEPSGFSRSQRAGCWNVGTHSPAPGRGPRTDSRAALWLPSGFNPLASVLSHVWTRSVDFPPTKHTSIFQ